MTDILDRLADALEWGVKAAEQQAKANRACADPSPKLGQPLSEDDRRVFKLAAMQMDDISIVLATMAAALRHDLGRAGIPSLDQLTEKLGRRTEPAHRG